MKTTVKHLSETKVELTVELDTSELDTARQVATTKLARKVRVPGFRQGKAPASVAGKYIDPMRLSEQTLEDALSKGVAEAFVAEKLQALERPSVSITTYEPGEALTFTAEAEILPDIQLCDYKKLGVDRPKASVTDRDVDEVVQRLRASQADKKPVEREAGDGDEVVIDFTGTREGVPFSGGSATDYHLLLGSHSFIPGFEEGIVGKKAGDSFDLDLKFPEDYHAGDLKGADVTFSVTLHAVNEVVPPELNDEFAATSGPFKTVAELKKSIKEELLKQKEAESLNAYKDALVTALIEKSTVPVPQVLLDDQSRSIEQDTTQNLAYQGRTLEQYIYEQGFETKETWLEDEIAPLAKKRVQAGLALAELSKLEHVTATTADVDEQVARYKEQYKNNQSMIERFDSPETRQDIASRLLTDKTIDWLVEANKA